MNYLKTNEGGGTPQILREITQSLITLFDGKDIGESRGLRGDSLVDYLLEDVGASDETADGTMAAEDISADIMAGKGLRQINRFLKYQVRNVYQVNTESSPGYSAKQLADEFADIASRHCNFEEVCVLVSIMRLAADFSQEHFGYLRNKLEKVYSKRLLNNKYEHRRMDDKPILIVEGNFNGNVYSNVGEQYIYPNKPEEKSEAETKTTSEKPEESKEVTPKQQGYFDSDEFREGVRLAAEYIKTGKAKWSHVYFFLLEHGLPYKSKTAFGRFIHDHGGPSARTVYKSGDYDNDKEKWIIGRMSTFFSNI